MINYNHHFFRNPKYVMNHICFQNGDQWEVHERKSYSPGINNTEKPQSLKPSQYGAPLAVGMTVESAICSAEKLGIKHFDIEVVPYV